MKRVGEWIRGGFGMVFDLGRTTSALVLAGQMAVSAIGVLGGIIASRALGPEGRGDFAIITYWAALITILLELGIADTLTLRISASEGGAARAMTAGMLIVLISSALGIGAGFLLLPYLLTGPQHSLLASARWYLAFVPASLISTAAHALLLGLQRFRLAAVTRVFSSASYLVIVAVLWQRHSLTARSLAAVNVAAALLPALAAAAALRARFSRPRLDRGELRQQLRMGSRLQGTRLASALAGSEDRAIANLTLPRAEIGAYQIPASFSYFMPVIPQALSQVMFARMGAAQPSSRGDLLLSTYVRTLLLTTIAVAAVLPALPFAVPLVYGRAFSTAVAPAMIVAAASIFGSATSVLQAAAKAAMHVRACVMAEAVAIVAVAAAAWPLTRLAGATGLAIAYFLGRFCSFVWMCSLDETTLGTPRRDLWPWSSAFRRYMKRDFALVASRFRHRREAA